MRGAPPCLADNAVVGCVACAGATRYCSERCKARDAAAHAEECALERAEALPAKSWAPRLLLRALAAPGDRGLLLALQSKPLTGEQRAWWGAIREALGDPPAYERLVGALANNCITVLLDAGPDDAVEEVAVGLYAAPSLMNHACAPSCAWRFGAGGALAAVASRPVAPGEPLTAPYDHPLTLMASREHRRKRLSSRFGFACACAACDAPEQGRDTPPSPAARQAASVLAGPGSLAAADARAAWDAFVDAGAPAALRAAAAWDAVEALASAEAGGARLAERERRAGADAADALLRDAEGRHLASHAELRRAAALRARWGGAG